MAKSSTIASDVISSDKVEGTAVYNTAGDKLGSVDDLMIDKVSGQIRYAVPVSYTHLTLPTILRV